MAACFKKPLSASTALNLSLSRETSLASICTAAFSACKRVIMAMALLAATAEALLSSSNSMYNSIRDFLSRRTCLFKLCTMSSSASFTALAIDSLSEENLSFVYWIRGNSILPDSSFFHVNGDRGDEAGA
uniref:Uncharacterized protein n=1 Tax=Solanum lycopersicum TaxID=4081 RepID=A0A3Q7GFK0_SOLLC